MKSVLLILFVLFGGLSALYSRFKRVVAETEGRQEEYDAQPTFEEEEELESSEESKSKVMPSYEYFSYETADEVESISEQKQESVFVEEESAPKYAFDLRQAVIYQSVLNNQYINLNN